MYATSAATTLSSSTIAAMKRVLGIASPSKEMRKIGDYAGEGYVMGLDDWVNSASVAGKSLTSALTESAIATLDYIQALLNGDLSFDMTIRPVLDLTNVESGVNTLDSMFARRQAYMIESDAGMLNQSEDLAELVDIGWQILREIQNGSDLYLDDKVLAGRINRRLGQI